VAEIEELAPVRVGPSWVVAAVPEAVAGEVVAALVVVAEVVRVLVGELEVVEVVEVVPPLPDVVVAAPGTTKCSSRT
jgi:hypothetical protein